MSETKEKLFGEFQIPTTQEWLDKIEVDLKGADFQKRLVWRTPEGFAVQPFYRKENVEQLATPNALPGEFPFVRGNKKDDNTWYIRQEIDAEDAVEANKKALDILNKGIDSLSFNVPKEKVSPEYIEQLLDGIYCDIVEVNFSTCKRKSVELAQILVDYFEKKGYNKEKVVGSLDWDPLEKVMNGKEHAEMIMQNFAPVITNILKDYPNFRFVTVNSASLMNKGAYITQELGYALAWGNEYMQQLTSMGIAPELVASKMKFNMGISENYFMEIAKFRAARLLWAQIVKQYGAQNEACQMCINATTTEYNMTIFDAHVNLLRSQTETMSAALGGVHSIVVTPFDAAYETPDDFSERIARNQQLLLKEECHFNTVVDPGAGSYYIEELTTSIAQEAWKIFLKVEDEGGFLAAIKAGTVQADIDATNEKRHTLAAQRREFILGTNQFPNFNEKSDGKHPLNTTRLASEFEQLRLETEKADKQPVAFMLTIGNLVWRQARAQFSTNFLACAGYKVIDNLGFPTVEEGIDEALKAGADIVVICSSDDEYAEYAPAAFKYLDGRTMFVVAGAPACAEDLKAQGIEHFIHVKVNQLETLREFNKILKIGD
ncbi:MAG: methylmalonyl-CoA mutase small subunit [Prevotella sp.]|nr:methylmalonyl-CoA mutase small subunit [Prevotella sp.]MBR4650782.1 methylmalonyl-CoA mutase small subunit [Prevotella sp.]